MAAGVLLLLLGVGVLSRLFRHDLAGRLATMNLDNKPTGSATAEATARAASAGALGGATTAAGGAPVTPAAPSGRSLSTYGQPLAARGSLIGRPGQGTHATGEGPDNWQSDNAIDIAVPVGTAALAPDDGQVVRVSGGWAGGASRFDGYGVTIQTRDGNQFWFGHLERASVRPGDRVRRGQVVGASGAANGVAHLHLGQLSGNPVTGFGY